MSIRATILDNLASELATMTIANGYESEVASVLRNVPHSDELGTTNPVIVIDDAGPDVIIAQGGGNKTLTAFDVGIRGYVRNASGSKPPTAELGKMIADLQKVIDKPLVLGANARYAVWMDIETRILTERVGVVLLVMHIVYAYTRTAP